MTYKTHLLGGAQAGIIAASFCKTPAEGALVIGTALIGSVLPDIDYSKSKLCRSDLLVGAAARVLSRFTKHRGLTHTIPGAVIFALLTFLGATYKTASENLFAVYAALAVFCVLHVISGMLGKFGLILGIITYLSGPDIVAFFRDHAVSFTIDPDSARLCAIGIFAGCISHMLYDTFNSGGIMWLWPVSRKSISIAGIKTRSHAEGLFFAAQVAVFAVLAAVCFHDASVVKMLQELRSCIL